MLLLMILQPTPQKLTPQLGSLLEKYAWAEEVTNSGIEKLCSCNSSLCITLHFCRESLRRIVPLVAVSGHGLPSQGPGCIVSPGGRSSETLIYRANGLDACFNKDYGRMKLLKSILLNLFLIRLILRRSYVFRDKSLCGKLLRIFIG